MKTATKPATTGTLHYSEACKKRTRHGPVADGDEEHKIIRCHECGQRPDRQRDGYQRWADCPSCGNRTTARYCDEEGMDVFAIECEKCGPTMVSHDDLIQSQTKTHKDSLRIAQAMADTILNADHHLVGGRTVNSVTITVGSATATASRKA